MPDDGPRTATQGSPPADVAVTSKSRAPQAPRDGAGDKKAKTARSRWSFLTELPALLLISLVLALLIKSFVFQAFYIPSDSMVPTLQRGDRVLVNKVVYRFHPPRRGDVIVFADPQPLPQEDRNPLSAFWHWLTEGFGLTANPERDFIKRVIALPGETIELHSGRVLINGQVIVDEPYLSPIEDLSDFPPFTVPADTLFVMGDNRTMSSDSRTTLGVVPFDKVVGRAFVIIWPPSRVGWLDGFDYAFRTPEAAAA